MTTRTKLDPGPVLSADDLFLFNEGTHAHLHEKLGCHLADGGATFAVWAPNAEAVSVVGDFNGWEAARGRIESTGDSGIWRGFVPAVARGDRYKFAIRARSGEVLLRGDPFAAHTETPPATAAVAWKLEYEWGDAEWLAQRRSWQALRSPVSAYEVHLGSWMRGEGNRPLTYREIAPRLSAYVRDLGFTHVELLPVMEHPFYGSWGYQATGYFAPTSRYGAPEDFMYLVDTLHRAGIGVILDWVPSHFPGDEHGLALYDGTHLFEHADPRRGVHPDWDSLIFNYGRHEVRSFLLSSATCWLERYHADGLRVDAVASMLYLDYSRKAGEWVPNVHGGNEDLDAIAFLRKLNEQVYGEAPGTQMIAEESTAFGGVSRPVYLGGLGFGFKWDMGWMHDTLRYLAEDPVHRKYHHGELTFRGLYGFSENFVLALSHDEVVHGKGSLLDRMPGDNWQKFANLRLLLAYQWTLSGKKLLFMGGEFGQWQEWHHERSLDWHLAEFAPHRGLQALVRDLNALYRELPALHEADCEPSGFEWIDANDADQSTLAYARRSPGGDIAAVVLNFTPVPRYGYRLGAPAPGRWLEALNSDSEVYGGGNIGNGGVVETEPAPSHGREQSWSLTLPPLGAVVLHLER